MPADFQFHQLPNGIRLYYLPTNKFKTISIGLFLHQELRAELAALNALLPAVLEQGCRLYPDYLTLQRHMENLYGAVFSADIMKSGERHILTFTVELPHSKFIGAEKGMMEQGLAVLGAVVNDPLVEDGAFKQDYVRQEKTRLIKEIKALLNDKVSYATERCIALMCAGERFGVYKLGRVEDYEDITPADLYGYYREIIVGNPADLYIIGDLAESEVIEAVNRTFDFSRHKDPVSLPETLLFQGMPEVRSTEETMNVNQSKLVLGYRTGTGFQDELHCALLLYNGILGGFPHSKLFMKVREEAGLAYYINSRIERHKGLLMISAGINYDDHQNVLAIIEQQLEEMAAGQISDSELANTRQGLINQLQSRQDSPSGLISFHLEGAMGGNPETIDQLTARIKAVEKSEIMAVAERIKLDTVYLLRPGEGGDRTSEE